MPTKIVSMKQLTPAKGMTELRQLGKTHGRLSPEYQAALAKMASQMKLALKKKAVL